MLKFTSLQSHICDAMLCAVSVPFPPIGLRIRTLRKRKGYNQQELADILGKSLRTVQKYESGEIEVSIAVANQLAEALDTYGHLYPNAQAEVARQLEDFMSES